MTQTVNVWVKQLKNGDEAAALNLYNRYSKAMYNTLIRITGDAEESQDLLQEAFIKAFRKIDSYREEATFGAWLKRIVVNTGLESIRRKKLIFDSIDREELENIFDENDDQYEVEPALIHDCIKQLPQGGRMVLTLFLLEDYSHQEIANKLGISVSTSKTQYMRAKKSLKEIIKTKIQ